MKSISSKISFSAVLLSLSLAVILALAGCKQTLEPSQTIAVLVTDESTAVILEPSSTPVEIQAPSTPDPGPQPTATPLGRPQYNLAAELDYFNQRIVVDETILIPHPSQNVLDELVLVVPPNAWFQVFIIQEMFWDENYAIDDYILDGIRLTIPLDQPWNPGEPKELMIRYTLNLPQQNAREGYGPSPFGYTTAQTNLVDWYPMVPPYQEEVGWVIHDPWIFGEYLVYPTADFEVSLNLNNPGLVVAASSPAAIEGDLYQYSLTKARNFVFSISPNYLVLEGEVNGTRVYGYIFPGYSIPGEAAFKATLESLSLYADLFGPYYQPSLTMVQADFNHGMEYEGLYFQSRGFFDTYTGNQESYLITIAVHETAHQWWYGQVANDQALEPWLDESLCTFSELVYYEQLYPQSVDWWWATRINYYEPSGQINRSIYGFQEYVDQYLAYRDATYLQGAKFLVRLRDVMGEDLFFKFLSDYVARYQDKIVSRQDFFSLLGDYVSGDLPWLGEYFGE
ncbi:MAG: M1 family metallopeptidase [Anaerolineales bacterium]|nr:M1 family metallopeptidase [Anaerolineales bacterium]